MPGRSLRQCTNQRQWPRVKTVKTTVLQALSILMFVMQGSDPR